MTGVKGFIVFGAVAALVCAMTSRARAGFSTWPVNGHSYEVVVDTTSSWTQASAAAQAAGGHLVTITSAAEDNFVAGLLATDNAPTGSYWIGLHRTGGPGDGTFQQWVTGEPLVYTNWAAGVPDNYLGAEDAAGMLYTRVGDGPLVSRSGQWNDLTDSGFPTAIDTPNMTDLLRGGYIIEQDPQGSSVPLPPAALLFAPAAGIAVTAVQRLRRQRGSKHLEFPTRPEKMC